MSHPESNQLHTENGQHQVLPAVSFDVELGKHFRYVDIDYGNMVLYMRAQGFPDDQIEKASFHVSGEVQAAQIDKDGATRRIRGEFLKTTKRISLYPVGTALDADSNPDIHPGRRANSVSRSQQEAVSEFNDDVLVHELKHMYLDLYDDMSDERKAHLDKIRSKKISSALLSSAASAIEGHYIGASGVNIKSPLAIATTALSTIATARKAVKDSLASVGTEAYATDPEEAICNQAIEENQLRFFTFDY